MDEKGDMPTTKRPLVIGVDVGGTNTDSALVDLSLSGPDAVLSSNKAATTANVTTGVQTTLKCLLEDWGGPAEDVAALAIGTTHFINAIIERDSSRVEKVAVLRLAAYDFSTGTPPFCDWPAPLRRTVHGHSAVVPGGVNIDGKELAPVDPAAVREQAAVIRDKGLRNIVIAGIGSPDDDRWRQEETVRDILVQELCDGGDGDAYNIVCSKEVAGKGLLARENAAILNASILNFARRTIRSLVAGMRSLGLACPLYLTSNSGHLLPFSDALRFPIRIFSSGATNSMRGAAFLAGEHVIRNGCIVVDIGGTTSDVGFLMRNGYPRLSKAFTDLSGVKVNLEMPSVESVGLGGGSILHIDQGPAGAVTVGPESVGHHLTTEALCFGGNTATASDIAVSLGADIGQTHQVQLPGHITTKAKARMKRVLETYIDRIKLSPDLCTAILVGGGSILCPADLNGVSQIIFPRHAGVANAVGAAMAKIYGSAELLVEANGVEEGMKAAMKSAVDEAVAKGGDLKEVLVLNEENTWVPYGDGQRRLKVEVALPADHAKVYGAMIGLRGQEQSDVEQADETSHSETKSYDTAMGYEDGIDNGPTTVEELDSYRPQVLNDGRWVLSQLDIKFIGIGCYMLGSGGGGSPYGSYLLLRQFLSEGETVSIMRAEDLKDDDILPPVAGVGTPEVGLERPGGLGVLHSLQEMAKLKEILRFTQMLVTEVGGSNGIGTLVWGSSKYYNVPTVDGDLMGRAWPAFEMTSQYLHADSINEMLPVTMCSGTGETHIIPAPQKDEKAAATEIRKVCAAMGFVAGATGNPLTGSKVRNVAIPNTLSLSWRFGRAVVRAQITASLSTVADAIITASGGPQSTRCLFRGKIRSVSSKITETAHSTGLVVMEKLEDDEDSDTRTGNSEAGQGAPWSEVHMPFVNENLAVLGKDKEGRETVLATVPDLIFLVNMDTGENIGCQEYRYGLKVMVMQMAPHPFWTSRRGLEVSGPGVFQLPYEYDSPLKYTKPRGVIDEFCPC